MESGTKGTPESIRHFDSLPDNARVRLPSVTLLFSCSPATAWRRVRDGRLPAARKDGRMTYWLAGEIRAALRGQ